MRVITLSSLWSLENFQVPPLKAWKNLELGADLKHDLYFLRSRRKFLESLGCMRKRRSHLESMDIRVFFIVVHYFWNAFKGWKIILQKNYLDAKL